MCRGTYLLSSGGVQGYISTFIRGCAGVHIHFHQGVCKGTHILSSGGVQRYTSTFIRGRGCAGVHVHFHQGVCRGTYPLSSGGVQRYTSTFIRGCAGVHIYFYQGQGVCRSTNVPGPLAGHTQGLQLEALSLVLVSVLVYFHPCCTRLLPVAGVSLDPGVSNTTVNMVTIEVSSSEG